MSDDLLASLRRADPTLVTRHWRGLFPGLTSGGTSPLRLLNLGWLALRSCFGILFGSTNRVVIIRSTPPLLHLPVALLCRWRHLRCVFWLMDYHPVIEQRLLGQRRWLKPLLHVLDYWDRRELRGFHLIVVLDQAMAELVRTRNRAARVVVHPTWGILLPPSSLEPSPAEITFAYLGNFGQGHGWSNLAVCIRETARLCPVRLLSIGVPASAEPAFAALAKETNAKWEKHPRKDFGRAVAFLRERGATWGCVTMKTELAGCLSPSKFSGYLAAGVPLLYAGPPKTNAWQVCAEFGGGLALEDAAGAEAIARTAAQLASAAAQSRATAGVVRARKYFDAFSGETLAGCILDTKP